MRRLTPNIVFFSLFCGLIDGCSAPLAFIVSTPTGHAHVVCLFHGQECTGAAVKACTRRLVHVHDCIRFVGIIVYQFTFKNVDDYFIIFHYLHCALDVALIRTSLTFRAFMP